MCSDLYQEEMIQALLKSSISGRSSKIMKGEKEDENVALSSKGPSQE